MKNPDDILTIKLPRDQVGRLVSILDYCGLSDMNRDAIYLSHKIRDEIQFYRKNDIEDVQTADAVEIVRCKDCKHYDDDDQLAGKKRCFCYLHGEFRTMEYFCASGERRNK